MSLLKKVKGLLKKAKKISPAKKVSKKAVPKRKVVIKKKAVKKTSPKKGGLKVKVIKKVVAPKPKNFKPLGKVTHYYNDIKVAIVKFSLPPKIGVTVAFKGATTDFKQPLSSVQYEHKSVKLIPKGKLVGIKVRSRVREGDKVYPV